MTFKDEILTLKDEVWTLNVFKNLFLKSIRPVTKNHEFIETPIL